MAGGPGESDERHCVERAAAGDETAFRRLVDSHKDRVYALALRVTGSEAEAEEAAQDAFVRAWRGLPRFRGDSRFGTWLHRITMRCALDRAAGLKRRRGMELELDALENGAAESLMAAAPGAAEGAAGADAWLRSRRLEALVARLPEAQRASVALYYAEDRSVEEVARMLGLPENTVKTHLSRARAALRIAWLRDGGSR